MIRSTICLVMVAFCLTFVSSATAFVDKDCSDFPTQKAAQRYFIKHGGPRHDPSHLDADHDGIACEDNA